MACKTFGVLSVYFASGVPSAVWLPAWQKFPAETVGWDMGLRGGIQLEAVGLDLGGVSWLVGSALPWVPSIHLTSGKAEVFC